jgi:hypothetical protein
VDENDRDKESIRSAANIRPRREERTDIRYTGTKNVIDFLLAEEYQPNYWLSVN